MREIPLNSRKYTGLVAFIDDEDYALVSDYSWAPDRRGWRWYARGKVNGRSVYMHRLILSVRGRVDHEDGDGLNNQRYNLRPATQQENTMNRRAQRRVAYKGVYRVVPEPTVNKWRAAIRKDGIRRHLGVFSTPEDAARAYDTAARELFGRFAWTNF